MKILILKDKRISSASTVLDEVRSFYENKDIDIEFMVDERDFSSIPWSVYHANKGDDEGPDYGIDKGYIRKQAKTVRKEYMHGVDLISFLVHDDSWNDSGDGIWGWNLANAVKGYEIEQVRWDPDNSTNTVGTLYHEIAHSHDSFVYRNVGRWIERIVGVGDWDNDVIHGGASQYEYIQHDENQDALQAIADVLNQASEKRREKQKDRTKLQKRIINLAKRVIELYRELAIKTKKTDKPIRRDSIRSWVTLHNELPQE